MNDLVLNGTEIRVDEHGRYCLTDLWKAGGSVAKDKPSQFTKQDSCKNLVEYLNERNRSFEAIATNTRQIHWRHVGAKACGLCLCDVDQPVISSKSD